MPSDPTSLTGFLGSLVRGFLSLLRDNRLATILSAVALVTTSILAITSQYDERPRYRQVLLPDIQKAEAQFFGSMREAEKTSNERWRLYYFLSAHQKARDVLSLLKMRKPRTQAGLRAHKELIRYYDLVIEELAIIRTQMSIDEDLDYISTWKQREAEFEPVRERWTNWVGLGPGQ